MNFAVASILLMTLELILLTESLSAKAAFEFMNLVVQNLYVLLQV